MLVARSALFKRKYRTHHVEVLSYALHLPKDDSNNWHVFIFWLDLSLVQFVLAGFSVQKSTLLVAISISYNRSSVTDKEALSKDDVELAMSGVFPKAYCEN